VYGETAELPMGESHVTHPHSPYGVTKLSGEALCLLYKKNYGLPVVSLRFFTVFGPRQRPDMAFHKFISGALDGKPVEVFGNGSQTRDFTYVGDIVNANLRAMDYDGGESVFNIGGGNRVTLNVALDILTECLPKSSEMNVVYKEPIKGDVSHTYADISLAVRELGYSPGTSLEDGMRQEIEWIVSLKKKLRSD
jgi:UDP-glucose 4-epimerase